MTITVPTTEPLEITAGLSSSWTVYLDNYKPEDGYILKYYLLKHGHQIVITGSDNGDSKHLIEITSAISTGYDAGDYQFRKTIDLDGDDMYPIEIGYGKIKVNPNFITSTSGRDVRSHARITLDNIQATIRRGTIKGEKSYSINGKNVERFTWDELIKAEAKYIQYVKQEEQAEKIKNGLGNSSKVMVRFT